MSKTSVSCESISYETSSNIHRQVSIKSAKRAFRTRLPPKVTCQSLRMPFTAVAKRDLAYGPCKVVRTLASSSVIYKWGGDCYGSEISKSPTLQPISMFANYQTPSNPSLPQPNRTKPQSKTLAVLIFVLGQSALYAQDGSRSSWMNGLDHLKGSPGVRLLTRLCDCVTTWKNKVAGSR